MRFVVRGVERMIVLSDVIDRDDDRAVVDPSLVGKRPFVAQQRPVRGCRLMTSPTRSLGLDIAVGLVSECLSVDEDDLSGRLLVHDEDHDRADLRVRCEGAAREGRRQRGGRGPRSGACAGAAAAAVAERGRRQRRMIARAAAGSQHVSIKSRPGELSGRIEAWPANRLRSERDSSRAPTVAVSVRRRRIRPAGGRRRRARCVASEVEGSRASTASRTPSRTIVASIS